jgi:hypothetical protein
MSRSGGPQGHVAAFARIVSLGRQRPTEESSGFLPLM